MRLVSCHKETYDMSTDLSAGEEGAITAYKDAHPACRDLLINFKKYLICPTE